MMELLALSKTVFGIGSPKGATSLATLLTQQYDAGGVTSDGIDNTAKLGQLIMFKVSRM